MTQLVKAIALTIAILALPACASTMSAHDSVSCNGWDEQVKCGPTADCAALLYNKASAVMSASAQLATRKLYVSAATGYRQAACMLKCARTKLAEAQLNDFRDWQVANTFGLRNRIEEAINTCDRLSSAYEWRR
jgi:hypothetical protein